MALLDMQIPGTDGFRLAQEIRGQRQVPPVRLVSLFFVGQPVDVQAIKALGIEACLTKPVRQAVLYECMKFLLDKSAEGEPVPSQVEDLRSAPKKKAA